VYKGQSGALNEAIADMIGETIQLLDQPEAMRTNRTNCDVSTTKRWIIGDELPSSISYVNNAGQAAGFRDMFNPFCFNDPIYTFNDGIYAYVGYLDLINTLLLIIAHFDCF